MAEGEGFEPSLQVAPDYLVSNETPSTTWVTLRLLNFNTLLYFFPHIIFYVIINLWQKLSKTYLGKPKNT